MNETKLTAPQCALCSEKDKVCRVIEGSGPAYCPTNNKKKSIEKAIKEYENPRIREFAKTASIQEAECYENRNIKPYILHPVKPRVEEICEFAQKMGYQRLGLAFCLGLMNEAAIFEKILKNHGFEVISAMCKAGKATKDRIGIRDEEKVFQGTNETMCNPIAQAMIINESGVDMAIMLGLCIGHDTLFIKYCNIPLTILAVKDRVFGHNPLVALYLSGTYYHRLTNKIE